jgi:hypothetical protein
VTAAGVFLTQVQMPCQSTQNTVNCSISWSSIPDEYSSHSELSIEDAIPHIIDFVIDDDDSICLAGADALSKLSEHGKVFDFMVLHS